MDMIELPSGNTIDGETWAAMKAGGTWRGWLDPHMYPQGDRDFMTRELVRSVYLVKVQGCPVGTVTTLGTITGIIRPDINTYVVSFDNGETVTRRWNQTLVVVV